MPMTTTTAPPVAEPLNTRPLQITLVGFDNAATPSLSAEWAANCAHNLITNFVSERGLGKPVDWVWSSDANTEHYPKYAVSFVKGHLPRYAKRGQSTSVAVKRPISDKKADELLAAILRADRAVRGALGSNDCIYIEKIVRWSPYDSNLGVEFSLWRGTEREAKPFDIAPPIAMAVAAVLIRTQNLRRKTAYRDMRPGIVRPTASAVVRAHLLQSTRTQDANRWKQHATAIGYLRAIGLGEIADKLCEEANGALP
jgi:hypothetical protein